MCHCLIFYCLPFKDLVVFSNRKCIGSVSSLAAPLLETVPSGSCVFLAANGPICSRHNQLFVPSILVSSTFWNTFFNPAVFSFPDLFFCLTSAFDWPWPWIWLDCISRSVAIDHFENPGEVWGMSHDLWTGLRDCLTVEYCSILWLQIIHAIQLNVKTESPENSTQTVPFSMPCESPSTLLFPSGTVKA